MLGTYTIIYTIMCSQGISELILFNFKILLSDIRPIEY